uniref:Secreted protein n=1 Tax=Ixodes scapularis TaxID=6945 RepID=A0A4D5RXR4_IXOSC
MSAAAPAAPPWRPFWWLLCCARRCPWPLGRTVLRMMTRPTRRRGGCGAWRITLTPSGIPATATGTLRRSFAIRTGSSARNKRTPWTGSSSASATRPCAYVPRAGAVDPRTGASRSEWRSWRTCNPSPTCPCPRPCGCSPRHCANSGGWGTATTTSSC